MAVTGTTEGQASGGAEEGSRFREGHRHLRLAYEKEKENGHPDRRPAL